MYKKTIRLMKNLHEKPGVSDGCPEKLQSNEATMQSFPKTTKRENFGKRKWKESRNRETRLVFVDLKNCDVGKRQKFKRRKHKKGWRGGEISDQTL